MSQLNDISLIAQVVVFHNTRAFDQLVRKYQSPVRRFFLQEPVQLLHLALPHCVQPIL